MIGILNIYKPQDYTSHDCVAIVRRACGVKKVGHTGTLDPMATGVLPVCIGRATRIIEYLDDDIKEYRCTLRLGVETDTYDIWGKTEAEQPVKVTEEQIREVLTGFQGEITQIPPKYSALKVNGKKLYEYAREGKEVEIKSRKVTIHSIKVEEIKGPEVRFTVRCSKGTYIRSICHDAGQMLGCGGTMAALERTASGKFRAEQGINIEDVKGMGPEEIRNLLLPVDHPLDFPAIWVNRGGAQALIQGKRVRYFRADSVAAEPMDHCAAKWMDDPEINVINDRFRVYLEDRGDFIGVCVIDEKGRLKADKIFLTEI